MTLHETIRVIEKVASIQPSVNMIVRNDIFRLNEKADARYGVFAWLQREHSTSLEANMMTFAFTFFYADRLTNDRSNEIQIQSMGIQTLDNIIRRLDELGIYSELTYTFQTFNQRFMDECAGVFCNVYLEVAIDAECPDDLADYNCDFNDDFLIY